MDKKRRVEIGLSVLLYGIFSEVICLLFFGLGLESMVAGSVCGTGLLKIFADIVSTICSILTNIGGSLGILLSIIGSIILMFSRSFETSLVSIYLFIISASSVVIRIFISCYACSWSFFDFNGVIFFTLAIIIILFGLSLIRELKKSSRL